MFQTDLDSIKDIELYRSGGLHPVLIGDAFANGRFKVPHKLGCGGSSTVWLERDQRPQSSTSDTLVALKVLSAAQSSGLGGRDSGHCRPRRALCLRNRLT
jgi:serine/threonine-protein kinase SRPK3